MSEPIAKTYNRCFISAPFGLELGALPELLAARGILWEWAKDTPFRAQDESSVIRAADFIVAVLSGARADYRVVYQIGVAVGLGKPVLLLQTNSRALPLDLRQFSTVRAALSDREALGFHLDLFLAAPHKSRSGENTAQPKFISQTKRFRTRETPVEWHSALERRVFEAVEAVGSAVLSEPARDLTTKFRPDLLAWLGSQDAELLDPTAIEVRHDVDSKTARRLEEQLLSFMQSTGVRTALILTSSTPPQRGQQLSPNIFWLTIDQFETLVRESRLGGYVRETRNRIVHGAS